MSGTKKLIRMVSERGSITLKAAAEVTDIVFSAIPEVAIQAPVQIRGFGSFRIVAQAERKGRNPRTGETVTVPAKTVLKFKASKKQ